MKEITEVQRTGPERIYLQVSDTDYDNELPFPDDYDGISWHHESVMPCEVVYTRADLAEAEIESLHAQVAVLEERLREAEKDASRYKLIKRRLFSLDSNYGDPPVAVITVLWWPDIPVGAGNALDKAIDAAIKDKP